jgi:dTDP-glucose pyrophosphorylase/predicted transcriptional regulator
MTMNRLWTQTSLPPDSTIQNAIQILNDLGLRIVLIASESNELIGTISDGDIRRGLLRGLTLESSINSIVNRNPITVSNESGQEFALKLMNEFKIQQIPVVDRQNKLVGLFLWDEITRVQAKKNLMVIMAGGLGTRLYPHTEKCPKPMLLVSGKPILEHILNKAKREGFSEFVLAIYHLGYMIEDHFGNGEKFGVNIRYLREEIPLGTAGALSLLPFTPDSPFIVTNGDVLTDIRYGEFLNFHNSHKMPATLAVRLQESQNPFGVVDLKDNEVVRYQEKPITHEYINAGVYAFDPEVLKRIVGSTKLDMSTLLETLMQEGSKVAAFPIHEQWLDVGRPSDFLAAEDNLSLSRFNKPN